MTDSDQLIIYHANCWDGFAAAWMLATHKGGVYEGAERVPAHYGTEPPDVRGKDVIVVDFSYPRETLQRMYEEAKGLRVLDHHKTAEASLAGLPFCTFDMERSGAMMACDFAEIPKGDPRRQAIEYVQDRDLWRWELPQSKEISAWLRSMPMEDATLVELSYAIPDDYRFWCLAGEGKAILRSHARIVDSAAKHAVPVTLAGVEGLAVNCTTDGLFSEVAGRLAETAAFGAVWFVRSDGQVQWSLRSRGDEGADVSEIAREFGGGGHRAAAGFQSGYDLVSSSVSWSAGSRP